MLGSQIQPHAGVAHLQGVSKAYGNGENRITALHATDLTVERNELLLIVGPSGSGKTTLLSLLGCVIYPTVGQVFVGGQEASALSEKELAHLRLRQIGFVFQNFNLVQPLTAAENVALPLQLQGVGKAEVNERVAAALELVGMSNRRKNLPKQLSGGQQQRISIARALVTDPPLMLCDEPTASLDHASASVVMNELRSLADRGKAVAVVTHDIRLKPFANRIVYVDEGRVYTEAPTENVYAH